MSLEPIPLTCSICFNVMINPYTLTNCQHSFCHSCVTRYLQSLINQGSRRIQNFKCPQCQQQINQKELEKQMDFEYFSKLMNKTIYQYSLLCPQCRTRIDIIGDLEKWRCFNCYTQICKFCKSTEHDGKCQTQSVYFHEVRTTFEDLELGYCPQCITPFLKDENCDHVTCQNPECAFQFCFFCSVNYSPIYHHGGIYHRTDCRNYETWQDFIPYYYHECIQCQKQQNINGCPVPTQTKQVFLVSLFKKVQQKKNNLLTE